MITQLRHQTPRTIAAIVAATLLALTAGCSSSPSEPDETKSASTSASSAEDAKAIKAYVEAARPAVKREVARYDDIYSDFTFEADGAHTIVYSYTYRNHVDTEEARDALENSRGSLEGTTDAIFKEMKAAGVKDPAVKWVYYNDDGSSIKTFAFSE